MWLLHTELVLLLFSFFLTVGRRMALIRNF